MELRQLRCFRVVGKKLHFPYVAAQCRLQPPLCIPRRLAPLLGQETHESGYPARQRGVLDTHGLDWVVDSAHSDGTRIRASLRSSSETSQVSRSEIPIPATLRRAAPLSLRRSPTTATTSVLPRRVLCLSVQRFWRRPG